MSRKNHIRKRMQLDLSRIVDIRTKLGISQAEVASALGIVDNAWCKREKGIAEITLKEALVVSKMFGMSVEEIFKGELI